MIAPTGSMERVLGRISELATLTRSVPGFDRALGGALTTDLSATGTATPRPDPVPVPAVDPGPVPSEAGRWSAAIHRAAAQAGIDPQLLTALVWTESSFVPDAVSSAGAIGLAQLMPETAEILGVDPNDPEQNLAGGARFLRDMLDRFGRTDLALAAYNAGPTTVSRLHDGGDGVPIAHRYVETVLARYETLRRPTMTLGDQQ